MLGGFLVQLNEGVKMLHDSSDSSGQREEIFGKSHKYYVEVKCKEILKALKRYNFHPQKVLDLGCGMGNAEEILHKHFIEIMGIDSSCDMIKIAEEKNLPHCKFLCKDALDTRFEKGSFDLVFAFSLFHHLAPKCRDKVLQEINGVLKQGGLFMVFEHNPWNPVTNFIVDRCEIDRDAVLIKLGEMRELCERNNFKIIDERFIIFLPRQLSFMRSLENFLCKIPIGGQYLVTGKKLH